MAKKIATDENITIIKKAIEEKKGVIGTDRTIKEMKNGNISKVYISSNCPEDVKDSLNHYGKLSGAEVVQLQYPNEEFAVICKKPFSISVMGIKKE